MDIEAARVDSEAAKKTLLNGEEKMLVMGVSGRSVSATTQAMRPSIARGRLHSSLPKNVH